MENTPLDQPEPSPAEPPPPALVPSPTNPPSATRKHLSREDRIALCSGLLFLVGMYLGVSFLLFGGSINKVIGIGGTCTLSAIGLLLAGPAIALKPPWRFLALGLMLGFLVALPGSCSQYLDHIQ